MFGLDTLVTAATGLLGGAGGGGAPATPGGPSAGGGGGGQVFNAGSLFAPVYGSSGSATGGAGGSAAQGGNSGNGANQSPFGLSPLALGILAFIAVAIVGLVMWRKKGK